MFDQALIAVPALAAAEHQSMLERLDAVRFMTDVVGWGVKDAMDELWAEHVLGD
jgi:hypothetical protein